MIFNLFALIFICSIQNVMCRKDLYLKQILINSKNNIMILGKKDYLKYEICDNELNTFKLKSLIIDPNPPVRNKMMTIKISGDLEKDIEKGAEIHLMIKINKYITIRKKLDFCEELEKMAPELGLNCPILKGGKEIEHGIEIPKEIPNSRYMVNMKLINQNDIVFCMKMELEFNE